MESSDPFEKFPYFFVAEVAVMSASIEYLRCTIRHNTKNEVATVRFLVKSNFQYFVATGAHRTGGDPELVEFYHLDRAYDDVNAERLAKMRGAIVQDFDEYQEIYEVEIKQAVQKFQWLNDRFVPTTLEELVGERELNLDDADTISSLNLSQCSGDTESDLRWEVVGKLMKELDLVEPDDEGVDEYNDARSELTEEALNSEITYRMLAAKYPEQEAELKERLLATWREKTAALRERFSSKE